MEVLDSLAGLWVSELERFALDGVNKNQTKKKEKRKKGFEFIMNQDVGRLCKLNFENNDG